MLKVSDIKKSVTGEKNALKYDWVRSVCLFESVVVKCRDARTDLEALTCSPSAARLCRRCCRTARAL